MSATESEVPTPAGSRAGMRALACAAEVVIEQQIAASLLRLVIGDITRAGRRGRPIDSSTAVTWSRQLAWLAAHTNDRVDELARFLDSAGFSA